MEVQCGFLVSALGGFYKLLESDWNGLLSRFWFNLAEAVAGYDSAS